MPGPMPEESTEGSPSPGTRRWLAALVAATALAGVLLRLPRLLGESDPIPGRADAIYVFPGEVPARPRCAVELWRRGLAPRVVFTGGSLDRSLSAVGDPTTDADLGVRVAQGAGLPPDDAVVLREGTSTWEDAFAVARWARSSGARTIVAVTSPLHARRARRSLEAALRSSGATAIVLACGPRLAGTAWWWDEKSLVAVAVEIAKSFLYEFRHFLPARIGLGGDPGENDPARSPGAAAGAAALPS